MSEVLIGKLDDAVVKQLDSRDGNNGRSLQAELRIIPEQAARPAAARLSRAEYRSLADQLRAAVGDQIQTDSALLLAEDRAR